MRKFSYKQVSVAGALVIFLSILIWSCGGQDGPAQPGAQPAPPPPQAIPYAPTLEPLGGYELSCGKNQASQQQKQVTFQHQQQSSSTQSCSPHLQFSESKITNFIVNLDCPNRRVIVQNKGFEEKKAILPIQSGGRIQGQLNFKQQVQNDGHGNTLCFVEDTVIFSGSASCNLGSSPRLDLTTQIQFNPAELEQEVFVSLDGDEFPEDPFPSVSPSVSPSPIFSPPPTDVPEIFPSFSPSPIATVTEIPSPTPSSSPSGDSNCSFTAPLVRRQSEVGISIPTGASEKNCQGFGDQPVRVAPGTQVTWTNNDSVPHTVTADNGAWSSGSLAPGQSFTQTLADAGSFSYHCTLHPNMKGLIDVDPSLLPQPGTSPSAGPSPSITPSSTPTVSPSPSSSPAPTPTPTPSPSPSLSPTPTPTPTISPSSTPTPTPTATVTRRVVCVIERPCPVVSKVDYSCPQQQE